MAYNITPSGKDSNESTEYIIGWSKGLNKLQDEALIDDHELSTSLNSILTVDAILKRPGSANFGSSSGSRVFGGSAFYTSATSNNRWIIREGGTALQYYNGSNVPTNIAGAVMTASLRTEMAMARDTLYVSNGTDPLTSVVITGGVPVASQFTTLTTPINLVVTPTGSAGTTRYGYRVSAYNNIGESLACVSVATTTGNATLDTTNYNALAWDAVVGAVGYVVYGRKIAADNGIGETRLSSVSTNSYKDQGIDTPSVVILPPEGNTTVGPKGTIIIYALSKLFISGDPLNPSRVYFSTGGTQITDFSSAFNGGSFDVAKNDGDSITAIKFYQNKIIIFKHHSTWQFSISGTTQTLELITSEIGCESYRTVQIVNNDLWFLAKKDGRARVFSLGNVQNYTSNSLRTTEQSLKISNGNSLDAANLLYLGNACSAYFRNMYVLQLASGGSTTNDTSWVSDSRFGCWVSKWSGLSVNSFFIYQDALGNEELYGCSDTTGYVVKLFTGTDDNGVAIPWQIQTKNFNQKLFDQYKVFRSPVFWFKDVTGGSITGYIINDGVFNSGQFNISSLVSGIGAGFDIPGRFKPGDSEGASTTSTLSDQPMEIIFSKVARSVKFELDESSSSGSFKFLGLSYKWLLLSGKPLPATNRIRLTA